MEHLKKKYIVPLVEFYVSEEDFFICQSLYIDETEEDDEEGGSRHAKGGSFIYDDSVFPDWEYEIDLP